MGARYLTDLADVCRSAGLTVHEVDGWQTRAHGSGGYNSGLPDHVMVHHTASNPGSDPHGDVSYICSGSENAPISNLYLSRSGDVHVCAAGATNTNGSGSAPWPGGCPPDSMNSHAIGVEAANNGTGEVWPMAQQDAYVRLCAVLCEAYNIDPELVRSHAEWAPGRKIDPAGPSMWASSGTWQMVAFREDVIDAVLEPVPTPEPPTDIDTEEAYDMAFIITNTGSGEVALVYGDRQVVGLAGGDLPGYAERFGDPLPTDPVVWSEFIAKSK